MNATELLDELVEFQISIRFFCLYCIRDYPRFIIYSEIIKMCAEFIRIPLLLALFRAYF